MRNKKLLSYVVYINNTLHFNNYITETRENIVSLEEIKIVIHKIDKILAEQFKNSTIGNIVILSIIDVI